MKKDTLKDRIGSHYVMLKSDRPIDKIVKTEKKRSSGMVIFNQLSA